MLKLVSPQYWGYFGKNLPIIGNQEKLQQQHNINRIMQRMTDVAIIAENQEIFGK